MELKKGGRLKRRHEGVRREKREALLRERNLAEDWDGNERRFEQIKKIRE